MQLARYVVSARSMYIFVSDVRIGIAHSTAVDVKKISGTSHIVQRYIVLDRGKTLCSAKSRSHRLLYASRIHMMAKFNTLLLAFAIHHIVIGCDLRETRVWYGW